MPDACPMRRNLVLLNVKLAKRFDCLLSLWERIEVRETVMASFIIGGGKLAMTVRAGQDYPDG